MPLGPELRDSYSEPTRHMWHIFAVFYTCTMVNRLKFLHNSKGDFGMASAG